MATHLDLARRSTRTWPGLVVFATLVLSGCNGGVRRNGAPPPVVGEQDPDSIILVSMTPRSAPSQDQRYALLVGISAYPDPHDSLPSPITEVDSMYGVLTRHYGIPEANIVRLVNEQGNRTAILHQLEHHLGRAGPDGVAIFFYSGHGVEMDRNYSMPDMEPKNRDQALYVWGDGNRATVILDDELAVLFGRLSARSVVVMLDGCFSGSGIRNPLSEMLEGTESIDWKRQELFPMSVSFTRAGPVLPPAFQSDGVDPGVVAAERYVLLSASEDTLEAYALKNWPRRGMARSVFGYFLSSLLAQADSRTSFQDVTAEIRAHADTALPCVRYSACQVPQVRGRDANARIQDVLGQRLAP